MLCYVMLKGQGQRRLSVFSGVGMGLLGLGDSFVHKKVPLHRQQQSLHKLEF